MHLIVIVVTVKAASILKSLKPMQSFKIEKAYRQTAANEYTHVGDVALCFGKLPRYFGKIAINGGQARDWNPWLATEIDFILNGSSSNRSDRVRFELDCQ